MIEVDATIHNLVGAIHLIAEAEDRPVVFWRKIYPLGRAVEARINISALRGDLSGTDCAAALIALLLSFAPLLSFALLTLFALLPLFCAASLFVLLLCLCGCLLC